MVPSKLFKQDLTYIIVEEFPVNGLEDDEILLFTLVLVALEKLVQDVLRIDEIFPVNILKLFVI